MAWIDIKGHRQVIDSLLRAVRCGRLAHSLLFLGPEGIGKKLLAKEFAKFLLCQDPQGDDACDHCLSCTWVKREKHPDLHIVSKSALEWIKIAETRALQEQMYLSSFNNKAKVFIIDNAHMLTIEAANSLLKLMEEPPQGTILILITQKQDACLKTIVSRTQRLFFSPLSQEEVEQTINDMADSDVKSVHFLARFCEGRVGRAMSLLGRKDIQSEKNRLFHNIISKANLNFNDFSESLDRENIQLSLEFMLFFFRDMLLLKFGLEKEFLVNDDEIVSLSAIAKQTQVSSVLAALDDICKANKLNRTNVNPKILLTWLGMRIRQRLRINYA